MALTIYKISSYLNWRAGSATFPGGTGEIGGNSDLSNYYTIQQLQTAGSSFINFENITGAYHNHLLGLEGGLAFDEGESSGMAGQYFHLDEYTYNRVNLLNFGYSLTEDFEHIVSLVGDQLSPGNNMYYGTDLTGVKGWYPLPEGFTDSSGAPVGDSLWQVDSNYEVLEPVDPNYYLFIQNILYISGDGISPISSNTQQGYSLGVAAGNSSVDNGGVLYLLGGYSSIGKGGDVWIESGSADDSSNSLGGDIIINPGRVWNGAEYVNIGNIYLGDNGYSYGGVLKEKTTETNVVFYNPTTGLITYGEAAGGPGGALEDDILQWYAAGNYYRPYPSMPSGMIYTYKENYGGLYNWNAIGYDCAFSDWFMPSSTELYDLLAYVSPSSGTYISSTEDGASEIIAYDEERTISYSLKSAAGKVWPIRMIHDYGEIYLSLSPGDTGPSGGMIFTSYGNGHTIYYEAAQSGYVFTANEWSNITNEYTELGTGSGLGQGIRNTIAIIGQNGHTGSAAATCRAITSHVEIIAPSFVAPVGWHVPDSTEIYTLVDYARAGGTYTDAGRALAEVDADYWDDISEATNSTGFSARGAGRRRYDDGTFERINLYFYMWAKDQPVWYGLMIDNSAGDFDLALGNIEADNNDGYSVRLIQDNLKDRDGNEYHTVILNGLEWTIENLKVSRYADGSQIPIIEDGTDWSNDTSGARCEYDNDGYALDLGFLYNGYAIDNDVIYFTRGGAHETGWRLPTITEWLDLIDYYEDSNGIVGSLMSTNWWINGTGTNSTLFNAQGSGWRNSRMVSRHSKYK